MCCVLTVIQSDAEVQVAQQEYFQRRVKALEENIRRGGVSSQSSLLDNLKC